MAYDADNDERLKAHLVAESLADDATRMNIGRMTIEEFRALPARSSYDSDEKPFNSIIILPAADGEETHDSGYRTMDVIGVRGAFPVCRLAGGSDHLWETDSSLPDARGYRCRLNVDCLPVSGLLRLWSNTHDIKIGSALSTLDITFVPREPSSATRSGP